MNVTHAVQQQTQLNRPIPSEQPVISVREIKSILYLGLPGGVDNLKEVENHTVDTYA